MARLKLYSVHLRAWSAEPDRDAVLLREGFCWPACLFTLAWALAHRLWLPAAGLAVPVLGLAALGAWLPVDPLAIEAVGLLLALWVGCEGNDWRRAALRRRGYAETGVIAAPSRVHAEQRLFAAFGAGTTAGTPAA
jgi:hypothetical protein